MKQVICVETGEVFPSARAAAAHVGVTPGMIGHVLKGRQKTAGGYSWAYTGKETRNRRTGARKLVDEAGRVYENLKALADLKGLTVDQVRYLYLKTGDTVFRDSWVRKRHRYYVCGPTRITPPVPTPVNRLYNALDTAKPVAVYLGPRGWFFEPATHDLFSPIQERTNYVYDPQEA